ncbi:MAG: hypothetical protein ACQEXJ_16705 [Myxococcota bacterium]
MSTRSLLSLVALTTFVLAGCLSEEPEGIAASEEAAVTVKMDFLHRPLPEIPLPNDVATRYDETSPTKRRINASMVAPTGFERRTRTLIDQLDGWGVYQPISIPFTGPLDPQTVIDAHWGDDYDLSDDVVYLVNVDEDSPEFGRLHHLDMGQGNYPVTLEERDGYWKNDPRGHTMSILFEEVDEDVNGNGVLDPGEDTDADGVLDEPNWLPGADPDLDDPASRADALMTFYERESDTLLLRPLEPLRERTTYAVVVTKRLKDADGQAVGSPYPFVHHAGQTEALRPLEGVLPEGLAMDDVAFAFSFTTQSIESAWIPIREGLYGHGPQAHLAEAYPAEFDELIPLRDEETYPEMDNPFVVYSEQLQGALQAIAQGFVEGGSDSEEFDALVSSQKYVDYHVMGSFKSPQLFDREGPDGEELPLNLQSWPADLFRDPAEARPEDIWFYLSVPREEVSARGDGEPAPLVILSHGYATNRWEALVFAGHLAKHGLAVLAIDHPSHGFFFEPELEDLVRMFMKSAGVTGFVDGMTRHRGFDQNADGQIDTGADFWTAYVFHTRDIVRQSMLDHTQLVRILRSFDGERTWDLPIPGAGVAGDFDGDGVVDVGGDAPIHGLGGSLGGIMMSLMGSVEPEMTAVTPIAAGGGLADIGVRSVQGGVREALILRLMGPLYVGTVDEESGAALVETIVPDLNSTATRAVAAVEGVEPGDTVVGTNPQHDQRGCAYVSDEGTFRLAVESDRGDRNRLAFYRGGALVLGDEDCRLKEGVEPYAVVETFRQDVEFQGETFSEGSDLVALGDGLGLRRANPELRRLLQFAQAVLDPADPAVWARHLTREPLTYPNMGDSTYTHAVMLTTTGDMNVPVSSGVNLARSAGFVDYLEEDPRYGQTPNQVLIDTHMVEAVHNLKRYTHAETGEGVHIDVDALSGARDVYGDAIPRLDPPLRLVDDTLPDGTDEGGVSGILFSYSVPEGAHAPPFAGQRTDRCLAACEEGGCGCESELFDTGWFLFNLMGRYLQTNGTELPFDACQAHNDCPWHPAIPETRSGDVIDE